MTELYTNMRYLQYNTLQRLGLGHFDSWAASFGETQTAIELAPEGTGYRAKTRFAKFFNLPELIALFKESADIQTPDMLKLPVPEADYENIVLKPSEYQQDMVQSLADRAEAVRDRKVQPNIDNMLKITNDGRKLALDQRLINDMLPDEENSKATTCVDKAFEIWEHTKEQKSAQLIFCDLSTPKGDGTFNVYEDIRDKLIAKGVPENEIAFIHNANTETRKAELFAKVRSGQVRFLLGSTAKMGAGTNVQDRLIALHHLDVPWRPSEEGRAGRYINKSSKIKAFRDSVKAESPLLNQPAQNSIDLTEFSGYNDFKVIYLLGMAFTFPAGAQKEDMAVDTEIKNAVSAADTEAQYDDKAKRLLSNKIILAHILIKTVDEFRGMNPKDVVPYIEGEPFVSVVPVEPGLTNAEKEKGGQRIVGMNTENAEVNEGLIRFDIIFYVRMKDGFSQVIVNLEAQKDEPISYYILNRAVFYVSRLVSSQKERDFVKTNYNDIKRVFSIWVCMNMDENSMDYVHLTDDKLLGTHQWKGGLDLLNIVLIGISDKIPEHDDKYELHRLLSTLFSMELTAAEKLGIMEKEYSIPLDDRIRKDVSAMCNLSQGIRERGGAEREEKIILNMHIKGYTSEQIAEIVEKTIDEVEAVIKKREPLLV